MLVFIGECLTALQRLRPRRKSALVAPVGRATGYSGAPLSILSFTGSLAMARADHTATLLPNGKMLVAGGTEGNSAFANAELYDPASGPGVRPTASSSGGVVTRQRYFLTARCSSQQEWAIASFLPLRNCTTRQLRGPSTSQPAASSRVGTRCS
jgi:hypothetical protein